MRYEVELITKDAELRWEFETRKEAEVKFEELRKEHTFELALHNYAGGGTEKWVSVEVQHAHEA